MPSAVRCARQATRFHARCFSTNLAISRHDSPSSQKFDQLLSTQPRKKAALLAETAQQIDDQITSYVTAIKPPLSVLNQRRDMISRLQQAVTVRFGPRYTVQPFGSTVYGVDSAKSDMDLVLLDSFLPSGFHPLRIEDKVPEAYQLNRLARAVRTAHFKNVRPIPASIGIVTAVDAKSGIQIDLNVNDRLGYLNSQMIKRYREWAPVMGPMLYFIKLWAKSHGLNSPSLGGVNRSLSSYCYALMTIGYLQHIHALPNLQLGGDTSPIDDRKGFWMKNKRDTKRIFCDTRYWPNGPAGWSSERPDLSLAEALWGWFRYWGLEHDYVDSKMAIRLGGPVPRQASFAPGSTNPPKSIPPTGVLWPYTMDEAGIRESLNAPDPDAWTENLLVVEDPFIRGKNVGGNITNAVVEQFISRCKAAVKSMQKGNLENMLSRGEYRNTFLSSIEGNK